jgi:DNA-binding transcriptional LysR family regulator
MTGLDDLYLFKSVVDADGLSAASRRLNIPKSTIARRLAELETQLGMKLFHRGARHFQLTNFGAICYERCTLMAAEADEVFALAERARHTPAGALHVICPPLLGSLLVDGIAADFAAAAPDVRLHLEETTGIFDPRTANADLVIYPAFKALPDSALVARKISTSPYLLVAHPEVLKDRQDISDPQALRSLKCLGLGGRDTNWVWDLRRGKDVVQVRFEPIFTTTLPTALLQAARRGLGVACLPAPLCKEDLARGNLVAVLEDWVPEPVSFFAIYPSSRTITAATRKFLDLLLEPLPAMIQGAP